MSNFINGSNLAIFLLGFIIFVIELVIIAYYEGTSFRPKNRFVKWLYARSSLLVFVAVILMIMGLLKFI